MKALIVCCLVCLVAFELEADVSSEYEEMNARLSQELSQLSQDPGKSLQALDALKQTPGFRQYPELMVSLLEASCFSLMNLGRIAESALAAEEGLALLDDNNKQRRVRLLACKASHLLEQGKLIEGYQLYTEALTAAQGNNELMGFALQYRARFFLKYESYQEAVNDLQAAFELYNMQSGLDDQANAVLINLGLAYRKLRNYDTANAYYRRALIYFQQNTFPYIVAKILHSIGETFLMQQNYAQAVDYLLQSEKINLTTVNENALLDNYVVLGRVYTEQNELDAAEHYLKKGGDIAARLNRSSAIIDIKILKAALALKKGIENEVNQLRDVLTFKDIDQTQLISVLELLIQQSLQQKDHATAAEYLQQLLELERRLYNSNVQQQFTQAGLRFDLKLAEKDNLLLRINAENNEKLVRTNADKLTLARALVVISVIALLGLAALSFLLWLHNKRVEQMSLTDELTKLPNRRAVMAQLEDQIKLVQRYGNNVMLGVVDIDHFKKCNDNYGHQFGDEVLKNVATACILLLRDTDIFGRLGGEEFLLLLPYTTLADGMQIAERLRATVAGLKFDIGGQNVKVTISLGLTQVASADSLTDCYERADNALYKAKSTGRNKVVVSAAP